MTSPRSIDAQAWIDAGLAELGQGGIDGVRVEVLAQRLGVTKGGFYRRFRDRQALHEAMLDAWARGRIAVIQRQTELGSETARERLRAVIRLFAERPNPQGLSIELAIRQWARGDARAAEAVLRVDAARLEAVGGLYAKLGFPPAQAQARAVLFYAFIFGQGLLFLDSSPRRREAMIEACTDALVDVGGAV